MPLESATYISDLVTTNPTATDPKSQGDDHLRLIKSAIKTTLPNITGVVSASNTELNYVVGVTSAIQTQINNEITNRTNADTVLTNTKANLSGNTFTGLQDFSGATVKVATPTNTTDATTKNYVDQLAFSTALPAQSGNTGKILQTNGTAASWVPNPAVAMAIIFGG